MRQGQSEPFLIRTLAVGYPSGVVLDSHAHPWAQLVYAQDGVMTVQTGQGTWVVPSQRAVWIPAGVEHEVAMSGSVSMRTLYLVPALARALPKRCCVLAVPRLLQELILHAIARGPLRRDVAEHRRLAGFLVDQLRELPAAPPQLPVPRDEPALPVPPRLRREPGRREPVRVLARAAGAPGGGGAGGRAAGARRAGPRGAGRRAGARRRHQPPHARAAV